MTKIKTNRNNTNNVPPLRFPEFSGEWTKCRLGELAIKVGSGTTPKGGVNVYKSTGHYFIRSQNVGNGVLLLNDIVYIDEKTHQRQISTELKKDDVLLNITGASIGRCAIATSQIQGGNVNQHVCIIRLKETVTPLYICYFLLSHRGQKQIDSFQAGGNRQGLNFEQIKSFSLFLPMRDEQDKISRLLFLLSDRIATQNKIIEDLEQLKSALTDQLYSGQLRFHEFADDWGVSTFGHLTEHFSHRNRNSKHYPVFSVTKDTGFIPQEEQFESREIAGDDISSYKIIRQGEFAYNPARINVGSIARYDNETPCLISSLYVCIKPAADIDSDWLLYLLKSKRAIFYYNLYGEGGVRIYLFYPNFSRIKVKVPSIQEQHRIAALLKYIADKILQEKKLKDLYMAQKQFLLQRLFI